MMEVIKEYVMSEEVRRKLSLPVVKLSIGAGLHWKQPFDEWINHDGLQNDHSDIVSEFGNIPLPDACVDIMELGDVAEHLVKWRQDEIWKEWSRVLKIGGQIRVSTPNLHRAMVEYTLHTIFGKIMKTGGLDVTATNSLGETFNASFIIPDRNVDNTPLTDALQQIYAWQTTPYEQHYDTYTVETLTNLLKKYGFDNIDFAESPGNPDKNMAWWLVCSAVKVKNI